MARWVKSTSYEQIFICSVHTGHTVESGFILLTRARKRLIPSAQLANTNGFERRLNHTGRWLACRLPSEDEMNLAPDGNPDVGLLNVDKLIPSRGGKTPRGRDQPVPSSKRAVARELCGFVWAIACQMSAPHKVNKPDSTADKKIREPKNEATWNWTSTSSIK